MYEVVRLSDGVVVDDSPRLTRWVAIEWAAWLTSFTKAAHVVALNGKVIS